MSVERIPNLKIYDSIINALNPGIREKARAILTIVRPTLDMSERVIYNDGTVGSHLVDLLKNSLGATTGTEIPFDQKRFNELYQTRTGVDRPQSFASPEEDFHWFHYIE